MTNITGPLLHQVGEVSGSSFSRVPLERNAWPELPAWATECEREKWGERLNINEWDGYEGNGHDVDVQKYRRENGWKGNDLVHSSSSPVRILEYRVQYPMAIEQNGGTIPQDAKVGTIVSGIVHFTKNAESHQGFCHGGSMCSVMDDIIGWTGFCVTGSCKPWSGFTVQVNVALQKPIQVGQMLKITCKIDRVERRKVFLKATLYEPREERNSDSKSDVGVLHASGEGIVIVNRGIL